MLIALLLGAIAAAPASADEAEEVFAVAVTDPLNRTESPLSNGGNWTALAWAEGTVKPGRDTTTGWGPSNAFPTINGAYWFSQGSDAAGGVASGLTVNASPANAERYVSVWLDMPNPGSVKSGYQLRWTLNADLSTYAVKLSKWVAGTETVLASNASVSIPSGTRMMISDNGNTVTAWKGSSSPLTSLLTASDSAFSAGYAGIEGSGNISRSPDFRFKSYSKAKILTLPLRDDMQRNESPLSFGGKWSKPASGESIGAAYLAGGKLGFGSTNNLFSSAYWNPETFSDTGEGVGVAATLTAGTTSGQWMAVNLNGSNLGNSATQNKYEARWTGTGTANTYTLELAKVAAGVRTVLVSRSATIVPGDTIALTEKQGGLMVWAGNPPVPMLIASDSSFTSGYAGISAFGASMSADNFQAGPLVGPTARIYWGALIDGNVYETGEKKYGDAPWDSATWNLFEEHAGKNVSIDHFGQPAPWNQAFAEGPLKLTRERGAIPMMDMDPDGVTLQEIAEGKKDSYFETWAKAVKSYGHPFFFRWTWEMNGTWFQWGAEAAKNPTLYKEVWWHLHDLIEAQGASNVTWVWCPNLTFSGSTSLSSLYPGKESEGKGKYVDWTCLDGYNHGTNPVQPDSWKSFATLYRSSYNELISLAPTKPVMIGEISSTEYGGDKAAWITDTVATQVPKNFAAIKAFVWFNKWESGRDWPIETSTASEAAFAAAIGSPIYAENSFGSLPTLTKVQPLP